VKKEKRKSIRKGPDKKNEKTGGRGSLSGKSRKKGALQSKVHTSRTALRRLVVDGKSGKGELNQRDTRDKALS